MTTRHPETRQHPLVDLARRQLAERVERGYAHAIAVQKKREQGSLLGRIWPSGRGSRE